MDRYKVKLTFVTPLLGTVPKNREVYATHVLTKAADLGDDEAAEELAKVPNVEEKGWTGFLVDDGKPVIKSHMVRGFFKNACGMLRRIGGTRSKNLHAYKKIVDGMVFVDPWYIPLVLPEGDAPPAYEVEFPESGGLGLCERPLRASTPQGERIALARSDAAPVGTTVEFTVRVLGAVGEDLLLEWLRYGENVGMGQWRGSGGYGRFTYEMEKIA